MKVSLHLPAAIEAEVQRRTLPGRGPSPTVVSIVRRYLMICEQNMPHFTREEWSMLATAIGEEPDGLPEKYWPEMIRIRLGDLDPMLAVRWSKLSPAEKLAALDLAERGGP